MDEQLILDTAEAAAPALRALAAEILQAEAAHLGVSLDAADVLLRRAEGVPALHVAAADDLAGPGRGDAEVGGDGFGGLAEAGSGGDSAVWSGVRLRSVNPLPEGKVTPDVAPA
jgi:hypothetical protein